MDEHWIVSRLMDLKPLTSEELREIGQRNPTEDTKRLLWEIKRLQRHLIGLHQTCISHASGSLGALSVFETYAQSMMGEPSVQDYWREARPDLVQHDLRAWSFSLSGASATTIGQIGHGEYGGKHVQPLSDDQGSGET